MPVKPSFPTKQVVTPSGITVTLKTRKSYGDTKAIYSSVFKDVVVNQPGIDLAAKEVTMAQANAMMSTTVLVMVAGWDVTEQDGTAIPFTEETMNEVFDNDDINAIMAAIREGEDDPKA